jgi:hypothetical protein
MQHSMGPFKRKINGNSKKMDFTKVGSFAGCCICIIASSKNHLKGDSTLMHIEFENSRKRLL